MDRDEFERQYWRYYLSLEKEFMQTNEYVEVTEDNYGTYSIEFVKLIQVIGAELDSIFKEICEFKQSDKKTIDHDYYPIITEKYSDIADKAVKVNYTDIELTPFESWAQSGYQTIEWWHAYNDVKHGRTLNIKEASLKNVLCALGGLFILNRLRIKELTSENDVDIPLEISKLFKAKNIQTIASTMDGIVFVETND